MIKDFPGTFPGAVHSGDASTPITVNYAGHVAVGMTVCIVMGNAGPQFKMFPAVTTPPISMPAVARPGVSHPPAPDGVHADLRPPTWTGAPQGQPTSITDSAGNTYTIGGAQGGPAYYTGLSAAGWTMPDPPWLEANWPDAWLAYCILAHAVTSSTVLTIDLSDAATFYVIGDGFAGVTDSYGHDLVVADNTESFTPTWLGWTNTFDTTSGLVDTSGGMTEYTYGYPIAGTVGDWAVGALPAHTPPGGIGVNVLNYFISVQEGPASDHSKCDVNKTYNLTGAIPTGFGTTWVNGYLSTPDAFTIGRSVIFSAPDADVPTDSVPAAFDLTSHSVHADSTTGAGGKRLDMVFESNGASYNAGAGWSAICLNGDPASHLPSWWDNTHGSALLANDAVNTTSGHQNWESIMSWWRSLIADATLDDPTLTGPPTLLDLAIYVTTTQTAAQDQACGGSLVSTLTQQIGIVSFSPVDPMTTGYVYPVTNDYRVLTGDVLEDGTVISTASSLESTIMGHELGFRLYHHHPVPAFFNPWEVISMMVEPGVTFTGPLSVWHTMTADVRVEASIYFYPPYTDPFSGPDNWDQPGDGTWTGTGPPPNFTSSTELELQPLG